MPTVPVRLHHPQSQRALSFQRVASRQAGILDAASCASDWFCVLEKSLVGFASRRCINCDLTAEAEATL